MFTSCSNDDNPVDPADNLAEKIIGKWMETEIDGKPALNNVKTVMTFVSSTKAIGSESKVDFTPTLPRWNSFVEFEVQKDGNKLTLTGHPQDTVTIVKEYNVTAIDDAQMSANYKHTSFRNGEVRFVLEQLTATRKSPLITAKQSSVCGNVRASKVVRPSTMPMADWSSSKMVLINTGVKTMLANGKL